jgi:hypothetical protein
VVQSATKPQLPKIKNKNETEFEVFVDEEVVNQYVERRINMYVFFKVLTLNTDKNRRFQLILTFVCAWKVAIGPGKIIDRPIIYSIVFSYCFYYQC